MKMLFLDFEEVWIVISIEYIFIVASVLLLLSIIASKTLSRMGVPALVFFLLIGMLAGSDGPGGIYFDDPWSAQSPGVLKNSLLQLTFLQQSHKMSLYHFTVGNTCKTD